MMHALQNALRKHSTIALATAATAAATAAAANEDDDASKLCSPIHRITITNPIHRNFCVPIVS